MDELPALWRPVTLATSAATFAPAGLVLRRDVLAGVRGDGTLSRWQFIRNGHRQCCSGFAAMPRRRCLVRPGAPYPLLMFIWRCPPLHRLVYLVCESDFPTLIEKRRRFQLTLMVKVNPDTGDHQISRG